MIPGALLTAALRYAELGCRVFPCIPGTKHPITQHGFRDASGEAAQIEEWWAKHPTANIGVAAEGLLVVDIDGANNPWPGDPDRAADLAGAGAVALTPRGGRHHLFRRPEGVNWKCSTGKIANGVDIRTDGGYIVVAPSEIKEGPYRWADTLELTEPPSQLPEPPAWLVAELDRLANGSPTVATGTPTVAHVATNVATVATDANPIPAGQRNATLARLAGSMRRVGMGQTEITAALRETNRGRCFPPLGEGEVDRIAASVARYPPDGVAVAAAENHFDQMYAAADAAADDEPELPDPGPIPDELLRVPGFIDEVMHYTLDTAPYPEPVLAFAGALTLQALLAGRKVRDAMDNRTNLYVLSLANSGVGKDHARKVNARILYEAGLADCLGTGFASGEGIEDRLFVQPASLFQVDEIDGLLLRVGQSRDARHEAIVTMLLQMYSSASSIYVMRAKANHERSVIDQPCLCLFGTAVPKLFYEAMSARLMTNGFLARLLILECRGRGAGRDDTERPIPASILEAAKWWAAFKPGASGNLADWHPTPHRVPHTDEAAAVFRDVRERADAEYARCERANDPAGMAIWARAYEKARRLALLHAVSACRDNPVITPDAATWAGSFVEHQTRRMLFMARQHASESEFDARRKRLLDVLEQWQKQHGDEWMPLWKVNRKLPWSNREHEEVRDTLLQQRLIEFQVVPPGRKGGRPTAGYRLLPAPAPTASE
ncbi:MAG: bifunctional DNA primase/polymerase [Gemmataceae bacterium]|nr:bifunctional DNA primase/polymerase [Gemmataceae bacterium]